MTYALQVYSRTEVKTPDAIAGTQARPAVPFGCIDQRIDAVCLPGGEYPVTDRKGGLVRKIFIVGLVLLLTQPALAQRSGASGSRPSFSGGSGSGSKPSFSGGSKPSPSPSGSKPSFSGGSGNKPSGSGSKPSFSGGRSDNKTSGNKPSSSGYDNKAGSAQRKAESKIEFKKSEAPKSEYKVGNKTIKIDPKDKKIQQLRTKLDREKYANRQLRQQQIYHDYTARPVVVYHDPYSSMFWWYLLDRSLDDRALWAYHHRQDMDAARYQEMLAKDARLEARIRELERQNLTKDPNFTLKGMDPDLQYTDGYVDAAYNPTPISSSPSGPSCGSVVVVLLWIALAGAVIAGICWLFFVKRW